MTDLLNKDIPVPASARNSAFNYKFVDLRANSASIGDGGIGTVALRLDGDLDLNGKAIVDNGFTYDRSPTVNATIGSFGTTSGIASRLLASFNGDILNFSFFMDANPLPVTTGANDVFEIEIDPIFLVEFGATAYQRLGGSAMLAVTDDTSLDYMQKFELTWDDLNEFIVVKFVMSSQLVAEDCRIYVTGQLQKDPLVL